MEDAVDEAGAGSPAMGMDVKTAERYEGDVRCEDTVYIQVENVQALQGLQRGRGGYRARGAEGIVKDNGVGNGMPFTGGTKYNKPKGTTWGFRCFSAIQRVLG